MVQRNVSTIKSPPAVTTMEIRGRVYNRRDPILIRDPYSLGDDTEVETFLFKRQDDKDLDIVWVWSFEVDDKRGHRVNHSRAYRTGRVITDNEQRESDMAKATVKKERAKAARTPKVGTCEYSGQPTKGGRFRPGMDAALKGALLAAARGDNEDGSNGDVNAAAELIARNWPTKDVHKAVLAEGKKRLGSDADAFVEKRVKARLAKIAKGVDPWEAASGIKAIAA